VKLENKRIKNERFPQNPKNAASKNERWFPQCITVLLDVMRRFDRRTFGLAEAKEGVWNVIALVQAAGKVNLLNRTTSIDAASPP